MNEPTYPEKLEDELRDCRREAAALITNLDYEEQLVQHLETNQARLLAVARAAEDAWPFMFEDMPKKLNSKRAKYEKLYEALKAMGEGK